MHAHGAYCSPAQKVRRVCARRRWEICELMRKLALSGFVLLVPESKSFARLTVATALSIGFLALLLLARPHRDHSTAAVAVVANLGMCYTLLAAVLVEVHRVVPKSSPYNVLGLASVQPLQAAIGICFVVVLLSSGAIVAARVVQEAREARRASRWELATLRPPTCTWRGQRRYAAFLRLRSIEQSRVPRASLFGTAVAAAPL